MLDKLKKLFKSKQYFYYAGGESFNAYCPKCGRGLGQKDLSDRNAKFCVNENCSRVGLETYFWIEYKFRG